MPFVTKEKSNEYAKRYRYKNKEKYSQYVKDYRLKNKEKLQRQRAENYLKHKNTKKDYYLNNKERIVSRHRRNLLKKRYNLTEDEYEQMAIKQNNLCFLCNKPQIKGRRGGLCVDHNHITDKVRKLLCNKCNTALGLFNEDISLMERAIQYLKDHN
jgi:hypothetical protein